MTTGETTSGAAAQGGHELDLSVLGIRYRVVLSGVGPADAARIRRSWQRCRVEASPGAVIVRASVGAARVHPVSGVEAGADSEARDVTGASEAFGATEASGATPLVVTAATVAGLEQSLTSLLTLDAIGRRRASLLMLHACGLADRDGRVLALVASSGTGKTTAARVLGRRWSYVTDETVAVHPDGSVLPYPKPLSVKDISGHAPKRQASPDDEGLLALPDATLRLAGVVLLDRRVGVGEPRIEAVAAAEAVASIVPEISYLPSRLRPLTHLVEVLQSLGGARRLVYSESDDLPAVVQRLFDSAPPADPAAPRPPVASPVASLVVDGVAGGATRASGSIRRADHQDAVETPEGDLLLLVDGTVVRVTGIGPAVFAAAGAGADESALVDAVLERHGPVPGAGDPSVLVREAVAGLVAVGALVDRPDDPPPTGPRRHA